jgi:anti-sigma B factor antagonist
MHAPFVITSEHVGDIAVVRVTGELDSTHCARLAEALDACLSAGRVHLVVDASRMTFCDSMGLRTVVDYSERAQEAGGALRLAAVHGAVARLLELTGVSAGVIPADPDVATAVRALGAYSGGLS